MLQRRQAASSTSMSSHMIKNCCVHVCLYHHSDRRRLVPIEYCQSTNTNEHIILVYIETCRFSKCNHSFMMRQVGSRGICLNFREHKSRKDSFVSSCQFGRISPLSIQIHIHSFAILYVTSGPNGWPELCCVTVSKEEIKQKVKNSTLLCTTIIYKLSKGVGGGIGAAHPFGGGSGTCMSAWVRSCASV